MRLLLFPLLAMTARFLSPLSAQTTIAVANSSFEDPAPTDHPDYTVGATGWTQISATNAGTFAPGSTIGPHPTPSPIDGLQVGYADGSGGLRQDLSNTFAANRLYTFSVYFGYRSDEQNSTTTTGAIAIGYFDSVTFTSFSTQSATVTRGDPFSFVSGSFQTTPSALGQPISLQLTSETSFQVIFDQVALSFTAVPEPAAFAGALGAGVFGIAWWRRRVRPRGSSAPAGA